MPTSTPSSITQAVPFLGVTDIQASLAFYVECLGFEMTKSWIVDKKTRWCWLQLDQAAVMLQQFQDDGHGLRRKPGVLGNGIEICFMCKDAIVYYQKLVTCGLELMRPFVGNGMWVTKVSDPDGYSLCFESPTNAAEESVYEA